MLRMGPTQMLAISCFSFKAPRAKDAGKIRRLSGGPGTFGIMTGHRMMGFKGFIAFSTPIVNRRVTLLQVLSTAIRVNELKAGMENARLVRCNRKVHYYYYWTALTTSIGITRSLRRRNLLLATLPYVGITRSSRRRNLSLVHRHTYLFYYYYIIVIFHFL
jgi:hypothetical protein